MAKSENKRKRPRTANFSAFETECLVEEIVKRAGVIENKRTDAITWKEKDNAWTDLTETFNARTASNRTDKMLKVKYDAIKRSVKQKHNRGKAEQFKTGGGAPNIAIYTSWEEKILQLIALSVEGLQSENDCDRVDESQVANGDMITNDNDMDPIPGSSSEMIELAQEDVPIIMPISPTPIENLQDANDQAVKKEALPPKTPEVSKWNSWTPAALRSPINKKLRQNRPSSTSTKMASNYSCLANSREELIKLQKQIAEQELVKQQMEIEAMKNEEIRKEIEHKLKIDHAIKEHEEKMELLQLQNIMLNKSNA